MRQFPPGLAQLSLRRDSTLLTSLRISPRNNRFFSREARIRSNENSS
jgi:hypothetical protein